MNVQLLDERFHATDTCTDGLSQPERTAFLNEVLDRVGVPAAETVPERFSLGATQFGTEERLLRLAGLTATCS
jgi:hypothetical protein